MALYARHFLEIFPVPFPSSFDDHVSGIIVSIDVGVRLVIDLWSSIGAWLGSAS